MSKMQISRDTFMRIFSRSGYIMCNRHLAKKVKPTGAMYYGELFSRMDLLSKTGSLPEDGFFNYSTEAMTENICLSRRDQRDARADLSNMGLIEMERRGNPYRWWYKIVLDGDIIDEAFSDAD